MNLSDNNPQLAQEYLSLAAFPLPEGRIVLLMPLTFGRFRIGIGNLYGLDNVW